MDLLSGLIGAIIGGLIASLTTLLVFGLERKRQRDSNTAALRRKLTVSLVRSFEHFRDVQANPTANANRAREVVSTFEADSALFRANIDTTSPVAVYVELVKQQIESVRLQWLDPHIFSTYLAEPLLRWGIGDPAWTDGAIGLLLDQMTKNNLGPPSSYPSKAERLKAAVVSKSGSDGVPI